MKKKLVVVLMAAVMAMTAVTGCGSKADDAKNGTQASKASESETSANADQEAAMHVADLIDAIYVQERTDDTDKQCKEAKEAWDKLTDAQKELVEGENADPDYFGRDTGDASKDDPRNQDDIGENEILVVSFGTSFNDSRVADIKGVEDAIALQILTGQSEEPSQHRLSSIMYRQEMTRRLTIWIRHLSVQSKMV